MPRPPPRSRARAGAPGPAAETDGRDPWDPVTTKLPKSEGATLVVVAKPWRGRGISTMLLQRAMDIARATGQSRFYLTAQHDKLRVYEKLGFVAYGEPFDDGSGILHLAMKTY